MSEDLMLFEYLLRLGDDSLILGHRLSEHCGHAPELEEDLALANIALDCLGHASCLLELAGKIENRGRSADDLVYLRDDVDFRNLLLVEQVNTDFAQTIARQFFFDSYVVLMYQALVKSVCEPLAAIAAKASKESQYHLRHSMNWVLRLGDGTSESRLRMQNAINNLWTYTDELFFIDDLERRLIEQKIAADKNPLKLEWRTYIAEIFQEAGLQTAPDGIYMAEGGRDGRHSEHLGHLLTDLQFVHRSHLGANW